MFGQLPVEIEDVAVGVAFAEDGDEAEDVALKSESFAVGGYQPLARDLRGPVERRLDGKGSVLGGRDDLRLAIGRTGR